eukprot:SAG31_NODE_5371_length_2580_cov_3.768239_4_plen_68_part_01
MHPHSDLWFNIRSQHAEEQRNLKQKHGGAEGQVKENARPGSLGQTPHQILSLDIYPQVSELHARIANP